MKLNNFFLEHCKNNKFEINKNQLDVIDNLENYYTENFQQTFLKKIFKRNNNRLGFYLVGDVGVGKTMILNFFFNMFKHDKHRLHFNEFMIKFHDFVFNYKNKDDAIDLFVKDLKREANLLYFDEFQVNNIVDAMILGKLFNKIFQEKINVIFSSNTKIDDLYKDGLQRDQFIPFIKILKLNSYEKELLIEDDYRTSKNKNLNRFLSPINQSTNFIFNKFFRQLTKNKKNFIKILEIKGRKFEIKNFFEGVAKFDFNELCDRNLGS